ncbi:MAG: 50S ribosomal protein L4 [Candidatus Wildermuthbacteria bacterium]|nr:50S ribosomal protein L4 [Candidatus Wildermuthbacteria bacterium]
MKVPVYNTEGKETGEIELSDALFNVPLNRDLAHQALVYYLRNRRQVLAHTKGRGEVAGGGKKPWAQKHTGRARHGSIRSPIWIGGGVTFGPKKERVFATRLNQSMRRKALFGVLSEKVKRNLLLILDTLSLENSKTKTMVGILRKLPCDEKSSLIALPSLDKNIIQASRNIPYTKTIQARDLNVFDVLSARYLVMPRDSVKVIEQVFH